MSKWESSRKQTRSKPDVTEEYINNLQQQIYFLELELNLLRDKEKEQSGSFPFETMETGPLAENIWALKSKYKQLEADLESKIQQLKQQNKELTTHHMSLKMCTEQASKQRNETNFKYKESIEYFTSQLENLKQSLQKETRQKDLNKRDFESISKERDLAKTWSDELKETLEKQTLKLQKATEKLEETEKYKNYLIEEKNKLLSELETCTNQTETQIKEDTTLSSINSQIESLQKIIDETSLEKDRLQNKARTLEFGKDLADKTCAQFNSDKKKLAKQIAEAKAEIEQEKNHQETLLTKRLRELESKELNLALKQIQDSRKETQYHLSQFKEKTQENHTLLEQTQKLEKEYSNETEKFQNLEYQIKELSEYLSRLEAKNQELNYVFNQNLEKQQTLETQKTNAKLETNQLFNTNSELRAQVLYLSKQLENNDYLKQVNLEEMQALTKSNAQVNEVISHLMNKWEGIQNFQKFSS